MNDTGTSDEELFSMDDLEKDLKKGRGGRRWLWLLIGLVTGVGGTIAAPRFLGPYLPAGLLGGGDLEILSGPVLGEERSGGRLLLTIDTEPGALIASFTERVDEIALLVDPGDIVTIGVPDYEPFVENPDFEGVKKASKPAETGGADTDGANRDTPPQLLDDPSDDDATGVDPNPADRTDADGNEAEPMDAESAEAEPEPEITDAVPDSTSSR